MSIFLFSVILFAAFLHALWNTLVKSAPDKFLTTTLVTAFAALIAVFLLPFLPSPLVASWPYIIFSSVLQVVYYTLVARVYHTLDIGQAYPIMRGGAPLMVAVLNLFIQKETLPPTAWLGICVISVGILFMTTFRSRSQASGIILSLFIAAIIASYTLVDGIGVRLSHAPAAYTLWIFLLTGLPLTGWSVARNPARIWHYAKKSWPYGLTGGASTIISYGLALWAMTYAPIAVVAALRESSILFVTLISVFILREYVSKRRIVGACVIALGGIILRLS
ncbi:EamA family transporter [Acetobacter persici]|uniref:DMT family transporter n=1 Tax=Acetobacter persici TaxID=1076596 RepID=UPI0020CB922D|nr:DMT family transporter [Acetobacter persici]MCP9319137.1 EamA family transporter [Acetobacter persici]